MNFLQFVRANIGTTSEAIAQYYYGALCDEADAAGIDWKGSRAAERAAYPGYYQGKDVKGKTSSDDSRVIVLVDLYRFNSSRKGKGGNQTDSIDFPIISFVNCRASYNQGKAIVKGEKLTPTAVVNTQKLAWADYEEFRQTGEIKQAAKPSPVVMANPKKAEKEDQETARKKAWNISQEPKRFERMLPLSHAKAFSPYLQAGCVEDIAENFDIRVGTDKEKGYFTCFPTQDIDGNFRSLQRIYHDPEQAGIDKELSWGANKSGAFLLLGTFEELATAKGYYRVEGLRTGLSIRAAKGLPVFVCLDAGNMVTVAEILAQRFPDKQGITIADNDDDDMQRPDERKCGNPGVYHAALIVQRVGGFAFVPMISPRVKADANEVHQNLGLDELKRQLDNKEQYFNGRLSSVVAGNFNFIK